MPALDTSVSMSSLPSPAIQPTKAPGLQGPKGLAPRQNYSRVNTGAPGDVDAGGSEQKSIMPKVGSIMSNQFSMAARPRALNDMLKTAMDTALSRSKIAAEARKQLENLEGKDEEKEEEKKEKDSCMKTSSPLTTDFVLKLASATSFIADVLSKEGADLAGPYKLTENIQGAGLGPNAIPVTPTMPEGPPHVIHTNSGQAGKNKPPENPGVQKAHPQEHGATQMENDKDRAPGAGDAPVSGSTKNAAPVELLRQMAQEPSGAEAPIALLRKMAEDAINPAQISAGAAVPPETSVTGEPGPTAEGKDRVPSDYAGVAGMTRREAKSVPKSEMGKVLDEPMMSASHDNVLQQAFSHTGEAGAKISSAHNTKLAAARALLSNLANGGK